MTDNTNEVPEITPLPTPPVGMPRVPITLFNVWTWSTPVIPSFYWNVYSAEQRIKQICKEIGRIEAYLDYAATTANEAHLDMANKINEVEQKLSKAIADLTVRLTTEVNRLDDLISAETAAREAGDEKLEADLETEVQDRQDADEGLHGEISAETTARIHADDELHSEISAEVTARGEAISSLTTRVATEESNRQAEDGKLGARIDEANAKIQNNASAIVTETEARTAADTAIDAALATKLVRDDLRSSGKITLTPGEGNTITIGDTFEADFATLQSAIAGLQASLASETDERRNDDNELWQAVNQRLERGKLLAGEGIEVYNDPDQSTVTVSAKLTEADLSAVEAKADEAKATADAAKTAAEAAQSAAEGKLSTVSVGDGLTGDGTPGSPLGVATAAQGALTTKLGGLAVNAGDGLSISNNELVAEVTYAELAAVEDKADTARALATQVDGRAQAAAEAATKAWSKADAATDAANTAASKAEAASTAATEAGSKAEAAQSAAEAAQAAAEGKLSTVAVSGPLTGDGTTGSPLDVRTATEDEAGVLTEERVKELAGSASITAERPLSVSDEGTISLSMQAPLQTEDGSLKVREVYTDSDENEAGVTSIKTIRDCFSFREPLKQEGGEVTLPLRAPLETADGSLTVKELSSTFGDKDEAGVTSINTIRECFTFNEPLKQEDGGVTLRLIAPLEIYDGSLKVKELDSTFGDHDEAGVVSINTIYKILQMFIRPDAFKD